MRARLATRPAGLSVSRPAGITAGLLAGVDSGVMMSMMSAPTPMRPVAFASLMGHVVFGVLLGLGFVWLQEPGAALRPGQTRIT